MDSKDHEGNRYLYIVWEERFCRRIFRINGSINFEDGKAIFKLKDGTTVRISVNQILTIGVTGNINIDQYRTVESDNKDNMERCEDREYYHKDNITPLFPKLE